MRRDELEEALVDSFDPSALKIYGDFLQAEGDPRGELIAIDLQAPDDPRRDDLLARWLGEPLAELLGPDSIETGFISDLVLRVDRGDELLDHLFDSPAGSYVRGVTLEGDADWLSRALTRLVLRPMRWLDRLSIKLGGTNAGIVIADGLARAFALAAPHLQHLEVWGRHVFGNLVHPKIRTLSVTGFEALGSILDGGDASLPAVRVLDLAFGGTRPNGTRLQPQRLPNLRRLDLSRNEPGNDPPHYLGGIWNPFEILSKLQLRDQLTHLRLPSIRDQRTQANLLRSALAAMPMVREVTIARRYRHYGRLDLPPIVREPDPWPWVPADIPQVPLFVESLDLELPLAPLVRWLEAVFELLDDPTRDAWCSLLELVERTPRYDDFRISRDILDLALDPIDSNDDDLTDWLELRTQLARRPDLSTLTLARPNL